MIKGKKKLFTIPISIGIIASFIYLNYSLFQPKSFLQDNQTLYYSDAGRIQKEMSLTLPDFRHPDSPQVLTPPDSRFELVSGDQIKVVEPDISKTHEFQVQLDIDNKSTFIANIFDFPGWEIYVNGKLTSHYVKGDLPTMKVDLDPDALKTNNIHISGRFTQTPIRKYADYITIFTILIISFIPVYERHSRSTS